jgi:hypothetical protein
LILSAHLQFLKGCRDYFETVRHIFAHTYYEPDRPLHEQAWGGLRWASLPSIPARRCSAKVAVVDHMQRTIVYNPDPKKPFGANGGDAE